MDPKNTPTQPSRDNAADRGSGDTANQVSVDLQSMGGETPNASTQPTTTEDGMGMGAPSSTSMNPNDNVGSGAPTTLADAGTVTSAPDQDMSATSGDMAGMSPDAPVGAPSAEPAGMPTPGMNEPAGPGMPPTPGAPDAFPPIPAQPEQPGQPMPPTPMAPDANFAGATPVPTTKPRSMMLMAIGLLGILVVAAVAAYLMVR
jgi:hypothetical protein